MPAQLSTVFGLKGFDATSARVLASPAETSRL
jgi:hypothetical protein